MNIPNILTAIRFVFVPFFAYYLYNEQYTVAVVLFLLAGITDVLDGLIARKFNMITSWGKLADPLADKMMQLTALTILTMQEIIPLPVLIIVVAKESFMVVGSILIYKKVNFVVQADWYGKFATVVFFLAIVLTIAIRSGRFINPYTDVVVNIAVIIAVVSTLFAFFMYTIQFRKLTIKSK
ncbi:CDP-alcohol phosphatidyltransferase family protein [Acetivibrio mesophilus]|uniref:Phosphatidylglycerophosphate synthase n=1 Tax=Acetivibrio mesophilus TaxID=2487273 RepID=A0A4Q0I6L5_9FIRM|nr:CDP-alcohol phosphatidyltransferase family protein [Acetivibrio mesophilus]ODM24967.1 CDP-diacylglycerol--glycerol-3-phosphate 3-phosphatidyltransferase [Clostridium sp. Bc-iso-3]RXE60036.1 CDP-alcohol phosphatidyltransferase family protein [Acetivibrio mesophilus]HHV30039.1 CDP-alcohol phosphatidyltransferase family protein [Clostridium sp.]